MSDTARIDKWLWAARIFKTRSIAADACKNGRVTMGGVNVKPSRSIKAGEVIDVRKPPVTYSFKILKPIESRVGAKLIPEIYENITDPKQYEILEMSRISGFVDRAVARVARQRRTDGRWMLSSNPPSLALTTRTMTFNTRLVPRASCLTLLKPALTLRQYWPLQTGHEPIHPCTCQECRTSDFAFKISLKGIVDKW